MLRFAPGSGFPKYSTNVGSEMMRRKRVESRWMFDLQGLARRCVGKRKGKPQCVEFSLVGTPNTRTEEALVPGLD